MNRERLIPLWNRAGDVVGLTVVDEADYAELNQHRWHLHSAGYATAGSPNVGTFRYMHRVIVGGDSPVIDHINGDGLDNRRANLRAADRRKNLWNCSQPQGSNPHRGVCRWKNKWMVQLRHPSSSSAYRGVFEKLEDAISHRIALEKQYFGEFAPDRSAGESGNN